MTTVGFLHTADAHVPTFRGLVAELAPGLRDLHVVDARLLADARERGVDSAVAERLGERLRSLADSGADLVVCTCSTLGGPAERIPVGVPVLRLDRPMAEEAVAVGGRIAVVATVASTLAPTRALLLECGAGAAEIVDAPCLDAWALFEAGDLEGYARRVAVHCRGLTADVIVLAQASMAPAAGLLADLATPVLTSPRSAVLRAAALATG
ncbi:aspartate/glutamate racemase family protein [Actinoplanes sp. NPDC049118]|uniref:aspartate/glutamate racemase family protein n=1 Tax=Actinoplanes sp. NPDC049118 TaxID=3155769 RepID=UPI00340E5105